MLFEDWIFMNKRSDYPLEQHPFHKDNNVSGANGDPNNDGWGIEIHTLQVPEVLEVQKAYVVYLPAGGEITMDLSATSERFAVEWIHAANGNSRTGEAVAGGAQRSFSAPFGGDAVLYLRKGESKGLPR